MGCVWLIVGIGLPGLIDSQNGIIIHAPELNWNQLNISKLLYKKTGWKVTVINNFKAHGLYELRYGEGKDFKDLIYIGVNQGIGGSIFQNKQLIYGMNGGAGEIGHMTLLPDGPLCSCGNTGCLEVMAAAPMIEQVYNKHSNKFLTAKDICQMAETGDEPALTAIQYAAKFMGIAMANLINIFNIEGFILGGFIAENSKKYIDVAKYYMHKKALSPLAANVNVHVASSPSYSGTLGAAHEALEENISFDLFQ